MAAPVRRVLRTLHYPVYLRIVTGQALYLMDRFVLMAPTIALRTEEKVRCKP